MREVIESVSKLTAAHSVVIGCPEYSLSVLSTKAVASLSSSNSKRIRGAELS